MTKLPSRWLELLYTYFFTKDIYNKQINKTTILIKPTQPIFFFEENTGARLGQPTRRSRSTPNLGPKGTSDHRSRRGVGIWGPAMAVALAPGLSRKLKKVLETRTDSPDVVASLAALSDLYPDNNPHARRSLRSSIERRSLAINHDFLLASQPALQVLKHLPPPLNLSVDHTFPKRFFFAVVVIWVPIFFSDLVCRRWIGLRRRWMRWLNAATSEWYFYFFWIYCKNKNKIM